VSLLLQVYSWFLLAHKVSVALGVTGYILVVVEMFGVGAVMRPVLPQSLCVCLLWYGLYFGVLGRDCAEVAADRMVRHLRLTLQRLRRLVSWESPVSGMPHAERASRRWPAATCLCLGRAFRAFHLLLWPSLLLCYASASVPRVMV
jgi:hypothetical protein